MALEPVWSISDESLLTQHYPLATKEYICSLFPTRNWNAIKQHAYGKLKLRKLAGTRTKNGDVSVLLEETPEAYYWMGFLLADGSFDKSGRVHISLSEKDKNQVVKFAQFLNTDKIDIKTRKTNYSEASTTYKVSCLSTYYGPQIKSKFDLRLNKTENPPDLATVLLDKPKALVLAIILGFIDGDGYIAEMNKGKNNQLKIEIHKNWLSNLIWIEKYIYTIFNETNPLSAKINARGYATLCITRTSIIKALDSYSKCLPRLERKWQKVK
jgi:hypothetical protein